MSTSFPLRHKLVQLSMTVSLTGKANWRERIIDNKGIFPLKRKTYKLLITSFLIDGLFLTTLDSHRVFIINNYYLYINNYFARL